MDMSDMLNKLLSDPSAMAAAAEIAGKMLRGNEAQTAQAGAAASTPGAEQNTNSAQSKNTAQGNTFATDPPNDPAAADMFASVLNDPSFMEKMPQMISALAPFLQGMGQENRSSPRQSTPPPQLPVPQKREKSEQEKRNALLLALKPYLSPERAETVDQIIRLTELITLFSLFK